MASSSSQSSSTLTNQESVSGAQETRPDAITSFHEPLSSELRPVTDAVLTIRVIKSFEFRTQKSLVLKGVDLEKETVGSLMARVRQGECLELVYLVL